MEYQIPQLMSFLVLGICDLPQSLPYCFSVIFECGTCLVKFKKYLLCVFVTHILNYHYSFVLFLLLNRSTIRRLYQCRELPGWWYDLRQLCSITLHIILAPVCLSWVILSMQYAIVFTDKCKSLQDPCYRDFYISMKWMKYK